MHAQQKAISIIPKFHSRPCVVSVAGTPMGIIPQVGPKQCKKSNCLVLYPPFTPPPILCVKVTFIVRLTMNLMRPLIGQRPVKPAVSKVIDIVGRTVNFLPYPATQ